MLRKFLLLVALTISYQLSAQEAAAVVSKDSIVATYLNSGRYLDAMAAHRHLKGELHPVAELLYQGLIHRALGRKQASCRSFQKLVEQYADVCSADLIDSCLVEIANLSLLAGDSSGLRWLQRTLSAYAQAPEVACPLSRERIAKLGVVAQERLAAFAQPRMHLVHQPPGTPYRCSCPMECRLSPSQSMASVHRLLWTRDRKVAYSSMNGSLGV